MDKIESFINELELLCKKYDMRIEERVDYDYDSETNEYTYVERFVSVADVENSISLDLLSLLSDNSKD